MLMSNDHHYSTIVSLPDSFLESLMVSKREETHHRELVHIIEQRKDLDSSSRVVNLASTLS
jgi:hypothetical protein